MTKYKKLQNVEYISGYDHYDRHRDILINFKLNEAEKAALDDLLAALEVHNLSDFIRAQIFRAFNDLTDEQKKQLAEVRQWRRENDHPP